MAKQSVFGPCSPLLIVSNIEGSLAYYVKTLGFDCRFRSPEAPDTFAIVGRKSAQIMLKCVSDSVDPLPNPIRHPWARWDAFVYVDDPQTYEQEILKTGFKLDQSTHITEDGLKGFDASDPDGYVCFFGHPVEDNPG